MDFFPIFLSLRNQPCLVVGGGDVGLRKARLLRAAHARVTVVSPVLSPAMAAFVAAEQLPHVAAAYTPDCLQGMRLVYAATNDETVNRTIYDDCEARGILINAVDQPEICRFITPSIVDRSPVIIATSTGGAVPVNGIKNPLFGSAACSTALQGLMTAPRAHLFESEYARISKRSVDSTDQITTALAANPPLATVFPAGNSLASQLSMVARLIQARNALGARRQVFFVSLGGFDTHDSLLATHPVLMATVGNALGAFYNATVELGMANQVTSFTASDFGRTLVSNKDGSDHGWGSMHFVLGGSVLGKSFVGTAPVIANNGPDDVGQGRLLPSLAVDQFAATLGTWFGVSATDQASVLPNLANYSTRNLGFLG